MSDLLRKALASAGGALGFLGLVGITGGAVVWVRFYAAGLPADQALIVVPRHDLVTIGAVNLVLFAVVGVGAVLVAYALDRCGTVSLRTRLGLAVGGTTAAVYAATRSDRSWPWVVLASVLAAAAPLVLLVWPPVAADEHGHLRRSGRRWALLGRLLLVVLLVVLASLVIREWWFPAAVVLAIVLILVDLGIAFATGRAFGWYGAALFLSIGVFGATLSVLRSLDAPTVQLAVVVRSGSQPPRVVAGLYVTQTEQRVYLGRVDCRRDRRGHVHVPDRKSGRIFWLSLDDVATVSVGPAQSVEAALARTPKMVAEIEKVRPQASDGSQSSPPVATVSVCVPPPVVKPFVPGPLRGTVLTGRAGLAVARRFRPILHFDSLEPWRPISVPGFLSEAFARAPGLERHRLCAGDSELQAGCRDIDGVADFERRIARPAARESDMYVDVSGSHLAEYCAPDRCGEGERPSDCGDCDASAIYFRATQANGRVYVDYWWFLRFNLVEAREAGVGCVKKHSRRCFDHEGDWEGVSVVTSATQPYRLEFVTFGEHERLVRFARAQLQLEGERPFVFVARGTHASYRKDCKARCRQPFRRAFPEGRHDGKALWGRNSDRACFRGAPCLRPFPQDVRKGVRSWNEWQGHWGSCGRRNGRCRVDAGPLSPGRQRRFQNPSCFNVGKALRCDPRTPGSGPAGRASRAASRGRS